LRVAAGRFGVLLTVDRNIAFQQNLRGLSIGILAPKVRAAVPSVRAGEVTRVGG
jgi:hypothetical protein